MTKSVESRFIAIVSIVFFVVVVPLITVLLGISYKEAEDKKNNHLELILVSNIQALSKPLYELDDEAINHISGILVSDPAIYQVSVKDIKGKLDIVQTSTNSIPEEANTLTRPVRHDTAEGRALVGTVSIIYEKTTVLSSLSRIERAFLIIFLLALISIFLGAIIGNRMMIMQPLLKLTAAIEATRRLGARFNVDWNSNDEMGRLAKSFNEMQALLEREEIHLQLAHNRSFAIYNRTPSMLFSVDKKNQIIGVSDYWVEATGHKREDVIGLDFSNLLQLEDRDLYRNRHTNQSNIISDGDATLRFICADKSIMDVLILEKDLCLDDNEEGVETLSVMTDVTKLRQSEMRNHQQAISDHLTGLYNRQGFETVLDEKIQQANQDGTELACLFIDLDRFKYINDNLGHAAGDIVLKKFVQNLTPLLMQHDCASRFGGDEFVVLLADAKVEARAKELCDAINALFNEPILIEGTSLRLSASIGMAVYPLHAKNANELLQNADMAMYSRKRAGKNGALIFDPALMNKARARAEAEADIQLAINEGLFDAYLQPIHDIKTRNIVGFEALMRINHPYKGVILPTDIIKTAEENGTITTIGNIILERALINLARISTLPGMNDAYVAVNFSAMQIGECLPTKIAALLGHHGISAKRLVIEITEAVLMHDDPQIRSVIKTLQEFGCRIALDDFGTGYSSLSYLTRFPVDIIKIDKSFTSSIDDLSSEVSHKSRMLVEGICAISHKMNCTVIAEGIETETQSTLLKLIGVDYGQGYHYAKPKSVKAFISDYTRENTVTSLRA